MVADASDTNLTQVLEAPVGGVTVVPVFSARDGVPRNLPAFLQGAQIHSSLSRVNSWPMKIVDWVSACLILEYFLTYIRAVLL